MIEHRNMAVWPETRALLRSVKASLGGPYDLVPVMMTSLVHVAVERLIDDLQAGQADDVLASVKRIRKYCLQRSRGELGKYWQPKQRASRPSRPPESGNGSGTVRPDPGPAAGVGRGLSTAHIWPRSESEKSGGTEEQDTTHCDAAG